MFTDGANGNLVGTVATPLSADLGTYGDHGGFAKTVAINSTSPAVDSADSSGTSEVDGRNFLRDANPDIGAFEVGAIDQNLPVVVQSFPATWELKQSLRFTVTISALGNAAPTIDAMQIPKWMGCINNGNGEYEFVGMPREDFVGPQYIEFTTTNGASSTTFSKTIQVTAPMASIDDRTLNVIGTAGNDDIHVWRRKGEIRVVRNGKIRNFQAADVDDIVVAGARGNEVVLVNTPSFEAVLSGGDGDDSLKGGWQRDIMSGGMGRDTLIGLQGDDALKGGPGDDSIDGGDGDDRLYGLAGSDTLIGGAGEDRAYGGRDSDTFAMNDGVQDIVSGDVGNDSADVDSSDVLTSIEAMLG